MLLDSKQADDSSADNKGSGNQIGPDETVKQRLQHIRARINKNPEQKPFLVQLSQLFPGENLSSADYGVYANDKIYYLQRNQKADVQIDGTYVNYTVWSSSLENDAPVTKYFAKYKNDQDELHREKKSFNQVYSKQNEQSFGLTNGGQYFLVMPNFAEQGFVNLHQFLQNDLQLSSEQKLKLLKNISQAYLDLHAKGIAHIDVKPGNIMVHPETLAVKLVDFECTSPIFLENDIPIDITPEYSAPELLELKSEQDKTKIAQQKRKIDYNRADVFSLSIIFMRVLGIPLETILKDRNHLDSKDFSGLAQTSLKLEGLVEAVKELEIPSFMQDYLVYLIQQMAQPEPASRPGYLLEDVMFVAEACQKDNSLTTTDFRKMIKESTKKEKHPDVCEFREFNALKGVPKLKEDKLAVYNELEFTLQLLIKANQGKKEGKLRIVSQLVAQKIKEFKEENNQPKGFEKEIKSLFALSVIALKWHQRPWMRFLFWWRDTQSERLFKRMTAVSRPFEFLGNPWERKSKVPIEVKGQDGKTAIKEVKSIDDIDNSLLSTPPPAA